MRKLGVRAGSRAIFWGAPPDGFEEELRSNGALVVKRAADLVFWFVDRPEELPLFAQAENRIVRNGSVWAIYPKGLRSITQAQVLTAGREAGLTDNKVCSFSSTATGLRFVIPVSRR